jgi:hypothetical protein
MSKYDKFIEVGSQKFGVRFNHDFSDSTPTWNRSEGHAVIVCKPNHRFEYNAKKPHEKLLHANCHSRYFVDIKATKEKAIDESWGINQEEIAKLTKKLGRAPTRREEIAQAIQFEIDLHGAWLHDQWSYVHIVVEALDDAGEPIKNVNDSAWGIETWRDFQLEVADQMALSLAEGMVAEAAESLYWRERDVVTEAA